MTTPTEAEALKEWADKKADELVEWLDDFCGHPLTQQGSMAVKETLHGTIIEGIEKALESIADDFTRKGLSAHNAGAAHLSGGEYGRARRQRVRSETLAECATRIDALLKDLKERTT